MVLLLPKQQKVRFSGSDLMITNFFKMERSRLRKIMMSGVVVGIRATGLFASIGTAGILEMDILPESIRMQAHTL
ncbi:hypothetical protein BTA30_21960 [Bacillus swezeyi]|uniref:Uncharacterized protein n=1 Tax=Bacillus swezeyi TaxID=1925020 RepID=A0A1R1Q7D6_9BACI|nr:hypothetical protein BW143_21410 [Bacillus swezeyi]OMI24721.1 hypothetical protein BTA30_21960 [Bacillus swezeyi]